jgi:hypothetical protein
MLSLSSVSLELRLAPARLTTKWAWAFFLGTLLLGAAYIEVIGRLR